MENANVLNADHFFLLLSVLVFFSPRCLRRYTITDGKKFGANFLVYDGSPQENHAFLTLKVNSLHEPIDPLKIIAAASVAHGAR